MEILHSLLGMAVLIAIAIVLSKHRSKINKRTVSVAFAIQFALGAFVLYVPWGRGVGMVFQRRAKRVELRAKGHRICVRRLGGRQNV